MFIRPSEIIWTKELDDKLLDAISKSKKSKELPEIIGCSYPTILRRIKEMGFYGLIDAKRVMSDDYVY